MASITKSFDPQALTSLTDGTGHPHRTPLPFRSTGSYEPDPKSKFIATDSSCFDPQALTSLTLQCRLDKIRYLCFDPQALTSLTSIVFFILILTFCFDPQALTSLTRLALN